MGTDSLKSKQVSKAQQGVDMVARGQDEAYKCLQCLLQRVAARWPRGCGRNSEGAAVLQASRRLPKPSVVEPLARRNNCGAQARVPSRSACWQVQRFIPVSRLSMLLLPLAAPSHSSRPGPTCPRRAQLRPAVCFADLGSLSCRSLLQVRAVSRPKFEAGWGRSPAQVQKDGRRCGTHTSQEAKDGERISHLLYARWHAF